MKKNKRSDMPSKAKIADYWKDKYLPNGNLVITDWYEPSCWACGDFQYNPEEGDLIEADNFNALWNHPIYDLERCHIIPLALGGSNEPSNLFLMCSKCHEDSPDTIKPEYFFEWVMKRTLQDKIESIPMFKASKKLLNDGCNFDEVMSFLNHLKSKDSELDLLVNTHGFKYSDSTLEYMFIDKFNKFNAEVSG